MSLECAPNRARVGQRPALAKLIRRRPTLPGGCPPSTIGAGGLNFSVRNGKRGNPAAMTAETLAESGARLVWLRRPIFKSALAHPQNSIATKRVLNQDLGQLV